jgi:hypothetical protein
MMKKQISIGILLFVLGLIIGGLALSIYFGKSVRDTSEILSLHFRADWERRAFQAYTSEKPEVAIWALENLADLLSKQYQKRADDEEYNFLQTDLILTYGRLALKFKATGNTQQYQLNISKSLELAKQRYKQEIKSEEDLLMFIKRADAIGQKPSNKTT